MATITTKRGTVILIDDTHEALLSRYTWTLNGKGYAQAYIKEERRTMQMHRFLWIQVNGEVPYKLVVDHKNNRIHDNRIDNLQLLTYSENAIKNWRRIAGKTSSQYPGVYFHKHTGKWQSCCTEQGRTKYIGYYDDELIAYQAYTNYKELANVA